MIHIVVVEGGIARVFLIFRLKGHHGGLGGVQRFVIGADAGGKYGGMYLDGDTIHYGPLEDGYKEYLETMAQWYSDGLIYHDFPFYGEQLDSWDEWQNANLDYSHVIPNKVVLEAENAEYNNVKSDIDTFLDEMTVKYITGEYSFDNYETDFVEALKGMNADRLVELSQDAYDNYAA